VVRDASTYLVVLDREEHETLRILLQQGLVCLLRFYRRGSGGLCGRVLDVGKLWDANNGLVDVLLVFRREVELLQRRA
jgi:hypothetical protein